MEKIINKIAQELNVKSTQVENAVKLIDDGNTIPFIARYRKEATGGLSDEILRDLGERLNYLRNLETRKGEVVNSINEQGKLTDELTIAIASAETLAEVEDLYRPFKQKKKTRATVAKAKGLEPLSEIIIAQEEKTPIEELASKYINIDSLSEEDKTNKDKVVATAEDAIMKEVLLQKHQTQKKNLITKCIMILQNWFANFLAIEFWLLIEVKKRIA